MNWKFPQTHILYLLLSVVTFAPYHVISQPVHESFNWTELGPNNFGGMITALAIDQNGTIYAGSVGGGLWKSTNEGGVWQPVAAYNNHGGSFSTQDMTITSIAIDGDKMYIGTGASFFAFDENICGSASATNRPVDCNYGYHGWSGAPGSGVFLSTDGEATFSNPPTTNSNIFPTTNYDVYDNEWRSIQKIVTRSGTTFVATWKGLYYTTDDFASVQKPGEPGYPAYTPAIKAEDYLAEQVVIDLEFGASGYVYATTNQNVFISSDNGLTFDKVIGDSLLPRNPDDNQSLDNPAKSRMEVAVSPSNPNTIYVSEASFKGGLVGVWRSTQNGLKGTWERIAPRSTCSSIDHTTWTQVVRGSFCPLVESPPHFNTTNKNQVLFVDPLNENHVFIGGEYLFEYTVDKGWTTHTHEFNLYPGDPDYVPAKMKAVVYDPKNPSKFYLGTGQEILRSDDGGNTYKIKTGNLNIAQTMAVEVGVDGAVYSSIQNSAHIYKEATSTKSYKHLYTSTPGRVGASIVDPNFVLLGGTGWTLKRSYNKGDVSEFFCQVAMPNAVDSNSISCITTAYEEAPRMTPFVLDEVVTDGQVVKTIDDKVAINQYAYYCGNDKVWTITNPFGTVDDSIPNWTAITPSIGNAASSLGQLCAIAVSGDNTHTVYVGRSDGKVYRITEAHNPTLSNPGYTFSDITPSNATGRWISSITVDPFDANTVLITYGGWGTSSTYQNGHIFATNNATAPSPTWYPQENSTMPHIPVYSAMFDPVNPSGWLLIGTHLGVYTMYKSELNFTTTNATPDSPSWIEANDYEDGSSRSMMRTPVFDITHKKWKQVVNDSMIVDTSNNDTIIKQYTTVAKDWGGAIYLATYGKGILQSSLLAVGVATGKNENPKPENFANGLKVYPNPGNGEASIDFNLKTDAIVSVDIYSMEGRIVATLPSKEYFSGTHTIRMDNRHLSNGLYLAKVGFVSHGVRDVQTAKIVIQN